MPYIGDCVLVSYGHPTYEKKIDNERTSQILTFI